jgi:hypothetical protein
VLPNKRNISGIALKGRPRRYAARKRLLYSTHLSLDSSPFYHHFPRLLFSTSSCFPVFSLPSVSTMNTTVATGITARALHEYTKRGNPITPVVGAIVAAICRMSFRSDCFTCRMEFADRPLARQSRLLSSSSTSSSRASASTTCSLLRGTTEGGSCC